MPEVTHISWFPDRTDPVAELSILRLDMSDGSQVEVRADTDVSEMSQLIQSLKPILFAGE